MKESGVLSGLFSEGGKGYVCLRLYVEWLLLIFSRLWV